MMSEKQQDFFAFGGIWLMFVGLIFTVVSVLFINKEVYEFTLRYILSFCLIVGFIFYLIADNNKGKRNKLLNKQ